ncbi:MAG: hypothetical protein UR93_C0009G0026 [Berkelbacteria bacterium GW2011_GWA2_35_9]|uniref:Glutaredoxin domain-containing protein n=1 Tax=Berkelbacteria bacterium GW2011_GWA2_35_9 TaxID=1618333 RepID=A0A0G0D653_9BACT|nr:MAG: hypothetical protein UR93_C0009G0026 [Berkelbacteria bacterium GW2011_GWA2_35_9]
MKRCFSRIILSILLIILILIKFSEQTLAENQKYIDFYYSKNCKYCQNEILFLNELKAKSSNITIQYFEIESDQKYALDLSKVLSSYEVKNVSVPVTKINEKIIIGFEDSTKEKIKQLINSENSSQKEVFTASSCDVDKKICKDEDNSIKVPILGEIKTKNFSLPILTIILGLADGFNPCAMWALVALISLLISLKSRKKLLIIGSSFLIISYVIYFLYLSAFLNIILYLNYIKYIQYIVGLIAVVTGFYYLKIFIQTDPETCQIVSAKNENKIFKKLEKYINSNFLIIGIMSVGLLAIAVNTIEMVCSVGIPAIFSSVLSQNNLSNFERYSYIGVYNLFYMLDDIIVFLIALFTIKVIKPTQKISYWLKLIGGILLIILGIIFVFKPELLSL